MKTYTNAWLRLLSVLVLLSLAPVASAYYDPGAQRWINRDPMEEKGGINLYTLVANAPMDRIDERGLAFLPPLPRWPLPTDPPFPWPLPNWPGATWCQRMKQCLADCETAYQKRVTGCADTYLGPCQVHNPILCAIDRVMSPIYFRMCLVTPGMMLGACRANCQLRGGSPWNW
jgi:hypothetical protein